MVNAVILSGGKGERFGGSIPKQYIDVYGKMLITYTIAPFVNLKQIKKIVVVAEKEWRKNIIDEINVNFDAEKSNKVSFADPGDTRQLSVYNGIKEFGEKDDGYVIIHDAARPLVTEELLTEYIEKVNGHDGLMPILTIKDTLYTYDEEKRLTGLLDRKTICAGQAPEIFLLRKYVEANEALIEYESRNIKKESAIYKINGSTEPAFLAGMEIKTVPGCETNFKITTKEDMQRFETIIKMR